MNKEVKEFADKLAQELVRKGFVVQRYDSDTTVYLNLDYGACNSIRISDQKGKEHLNFRYNIGSYIKKTKQVRDCYIRWCFYFKGFDLQAVIKQIKHDKRGKMHTFGSTKYKQFMQKKQSQSRGFWEKAYLVTKSKLQEEL